VYWTYRCAYETERVNISIQNNKYSVCHAERSTERSRRSLVSASRKINEL